jgi:hypothetical protein
MTPSDETPNTAGQPASGNDRMSILEQRLAEIQAKQNAAGTPAPAPGATQTELPAQGPAAVPAGENPGAGTAEATPVEVSQQATPAHAPDSPEVAAAVESARHLPADMPETEALLSAPQARAVAHYGETMSAETNALAPEAEALSGVAGEAPATPVTHHDHPVAPVVPLPTAAAPETLEAVLEKAPEGVATLPTSATDSAEVAADLADAHRQEEAAQLQVAASPTATPEQALQAAASISSSHEEIIQPAADESAALSMSATENVTPEGATAESASSESEDDYVPETPTADFATLDLDQQGAVLLDLLRRPDAGRNRKQVLDLNRQYEAAVGAARAASRQKFSEDANAPLEFAFQAPANHAELNKAFQEFRESRARDVRAEDANRGNNLTVKKALLDRLRELVEAAETKDSSAKLKALQQEWKAAGPVPQAESQELWNTYHGLLDIYYSNQGRFNELKDLDRRRNLAAKEALITRAEALVQVPGINKALDELKKLHEDWKNIGPVPNDQREPLWQRFLAASEVVHNRRKEFADARSTEEKANLQIKKALLERVLPFAEFETDRVNLWRSKTDELQEIKAEWEATGPAPRNQAEALNKQYWGAYKAFFNRKNNFFKSMDDEKNTNLQAKLALITQAEEALASDDWESARNTVIRVQKEWKDIGRVPEKQADKIWKRFRTACDAFFDRPKQQAQQRQVRQEQASVAQNEFLDKVSTDVAALSADTPGTLEGFREHVAAWLAFDTDGQQTTDRGEEQFLSLMRKYLDTVPGLAYAEKNELLFQLEVGRLKARPQASQLLARKEMALRKEIQELENDNATLQTNLDFFARSKNAAQLREEYQGRMLEGQKRIDSLKKQLKVIRS